MLKRTVEYVNPFTDEQIVEEVYFNINLAEATRLEMYEDLSKRLQEVEDLAERLRENPGEANLNEKKQIYSFFEWIVSKAYCVREGNVPVKSEELSERFMSSEAYSAVLNWLMFEDNAETNAADFVVGLFPKPMIEKAKKIADEQKAAEASDLDKRLESLN